MKCSEFLARFSEYYDEVTSLSERRSFVRHMEGCPSCRRYDAVVRHGVSFLRSLPPIRTRDNFRDRLRHSIYSIEEERRRKRIPTGGSGIAAVAAVAAVLAVMIWTPLLRTVEPTVELSPIVAREPVAPRPLLAPREPDPAPWTQVTPTALFADSDLWSRSNSLLYEYSHLGRRAREAGLVRTGLR